MSENTVMKMEDKIHEFLDGDLKEIALKFAEYLNESNLAPINVGKDSCKIPYNEHHICMIQFEPNQWKFTFFYGDYNSEFDQDFIKTVQKNLKFCSPCHDCTGALDAMIFGENYSNLCSQLTIQFTNPDNTTLENIKKLLEYCKDMIPNSKLYKSYHARF